MSNSPPVLRKKAQIASGQTKSSIIDAEHLSLRGLLMPAAFTGATMTFEVSDKADGTFIPLVDESGAAVSVTVTQSEGVALDTASRELGAFRFLKLVSGSAEAAAREIICILKEE
jgi:hypothetical protein